MSKHDEPKEEQPVKELEKDQSSTKVKTMSGAGKIRVEADKFAAKRRVEAKPPQDAVDGDDSSGE